MRKILIAYIMTQLCLGHCIYAQKHDYHWIDNNVQDTSAFSAVHWWYDEDLDSLRFEVLDTDHRALSAPVISSQDGEFLFYSNAFRLYDSNLEMISGSASIYLGEYQRNVWEWGGRNWGSSLFQNAAIIPITDSLYYNFQTSTEVLGGVENFPVNDIKYNGVRLNGISDVLSLTKVRRRSNGKLYVDQSEKKIELIRDTMLIYNLSFVKHANGNDWWMMIPEHYSDSTYLFRIHAGSGEIEALGKRYFSDNNDHVASHSSTKFSHDGSKMVRLYNGNYEHYPDHRIEFFDFDRCTGQATRYVIDSVPMTEVWSYANDLAFSPNDQFLYLAIGKYVLQLDMNLANPVNQIDTVAEVGDVLYRGIYTNFTSFWEVPNGDLLVGSFTSTPYLHYIHDPNKKGKACNLQHRAYELPDNPKEPRNKLVNISFPYQPHYRMPPLSEPCVTAQEEQVDRDQVFCSLYPNPARHKASVQLHGSRLVRAVLYDMQGRKLLESDTGEFDVSSLARGSYVVEIYTEHGVYNRRLMVM